MFFGLHTTTSAERWQLLGQPGKAITIPPTAFHKDPVHKSIVTEEGTGLVYEHDEEAFFETLDSLIKGTFTRTEDSAYYKRWAYKGEEVFTRIANLKGLAESIREHGIQHPVDCEQTGERLDGSFRTKIAMYLGIKEVPATLHAYTWEQVTEDFLRRKLAARIASSPIDYYEFDYGHKDWRNGRAGHVHIENASRWPVIAPHVVGSVLDLGCNEGYLAIQAALAGHPVYGYDLEWWHVANLNKLVFEWINKRTLPVAFAEADITKAKYPKTDTALLLNVIYHLPREKQVPLLKRLRGRRLVLQCNLRKEHVRDQYYGSHPNDATDLLLAAGYHDITVHQWKDKPIIVAK